MLWPSGPAANGISWRKMKNEEQNGYAHLVVECSKTVEDVIEVLSKLKKMTLTDHNQVKNISVDYHNYLS